MSFFEHVLEAPADPIFKQIGMFNADPRSEKVDLSVGIYRDEFLKTPILKTVKKAEEHLVLQEKSKEYLPISGDSTYLEESGRLVFGHELWTKCRSQICGIQTVGGTGALRIGGELFRGEVGTHLAIPDPTWSNHLAVFTHSGLKVSSYPYYDVKNHALCLDSLLEALQKLPKESAFLLHACCHNPTGIDLTEEQWSQIATVLEEKKIVPFFDFAYQGFGQGVEEDAWMVRSCLNRGLGCIVASSYSKNFGLYSERVGALFVVAGREKAACSVLSKLKILARVNYSNPPRHGSSIIAHILSTPSLKKEWLGEVDFMRHRIKKLREALTHAFKAKKIKASHLLSQNGMFCFMGLGQHKVEKIREEHAIYMTSGGRINLTGLSEKNLPYVVNAIAPFL